jgi:membrane protease subunit HflK
MPWNNQSGGGKNGGPWGGSGNGGGDGGGPWGSGSGGGPNRPNPWGGDNRRPDPQNSPDLEELLRRSQDRLKRVFPKKGGPGGPGGGGGGGGIGLGGIGARGVALAAVVGVIIYAATGIYIVDQGELGVELVFGEYKATTTPGPHYNWPYPIGSVFVPNVAQLRETTVGSRGDARGQDAPEESLMLTGDENIVDVDFRVQWRISNPADYLFNIQDPEDTVKQVAESAMRQIVGQNNILPILTQERNQIRQDVKALMQQTLDGYGAGVEIVEVNMQKVDPPAQVIDAFRDVQAARADQETAQNRADAYANEVVPQARGEAAQIVEAANAYRDQVIAEATGQADRFLSVYEEYAKAPEVTRERIYLETMERVLSGTEKVIIDQSAGTGVVPYLPLDQLNRSAAPVAGGIR